MLKRLGTAAVFAVCLVAIAWAAPPTRGINELGTSGAPVSVSTSTKVLPGDANRSWYCVVPETVDIRCTLGGISDNSAASPTPSSTVGFLITTGTYFCESLGAGTSTRPSLTVQRRLQCASTAGATSVNTWSEPY